ncbi:MAG: transglutaminase domain-containing protein [Ktedonobacteraceae bacterium]|nr:transglutaminase domain-containing protein [Ktedonobacteraceae bacterium]
MRSGIVDTRPPQYNVTSSVQYAQSSSAAFASRQTPRPPRPTPSAKPRLILVPSEGWSPLFLLAIALYCVVYAIMAAKWVEHSNLLLWAPVCGLLIGLITAKLPRPSQSLLHLAACLVGYWLAVGITGTLAFHISWLRVLSDLRDALFGGLFSGSASSSKTVFFFYLVFLCFFLGHFGSWLVYRARLPWLVALVYGSIMLVNLNYVQGDSTLFVVILLAAQVLLVARIQLVNQLGQWAREGLYTTRPWVRAFTARCMGLACAFMLVVMLVGYLFPVFQQSASGRAFWDSLDNAVNNLSNGHISLQDPGSLFLSSGSQTNFFGDQLMITGSVHLPTGDVLTYSSSDGPRYLEGFAYNNFNGQLWTSTVSTANSYGANEILPPDSSRSDLQQVTTDVTVLQPPDGPKHYLFGPAQPIKFSVPSLVYGDGAAAAWTRPTPLQRGETYQVLSLIPISSADTLAAAPLPSGDTRGIWRAGLESLQNYSTYLQVPANLSQQARQTARDWTQGATDAYSALKMLEAHLSDQKVFSYSVENPPIPGNTNVVDWLLKRRVGYCTYYASAMAMMGRLLGIPTRMMNGFSQGHFDRQRNTWVVTGSDAHSWVQAYFPSVGWVSFDPTPGFASGAQPAAQGTPGVVTPTPSPAVHPTPAGTAPGVKQVTPGADQQGNGGQANTQGGDISGWLLVFAIFVLVCSLLVMLSGLVARWWRGLYADAPLVTGLFWRLCLLASWVGLAPRDSQTPHEYGYMLSQHFPRHASPLRRLTDLFVRERWGAPPQAPRREEQREVERTWPELRATLLRALLRRRT